MNAPIIESCECLLLSYRYSQQEVWGWPGGSYNGWTSAFVRLRTADGQYGLGEIGDGLNVPEVVATLVDRAAPLVVGQPAEPLGILTKLERSAPGWGYGGLFTSIIGGIEMAAFDLLGKVLGAPASVLVGGRCRDELPVYASGGLQADPALVRAEVEDHVRAGFNAVKIRIGYGMDLDLRRVEAAREALGDERRLMLDLGASYLPEPPDLRDVVRLANRLERFDPYWLEEPLPRQDISGHVRLRSETSIRIATGECERTRDNVIRLLEAGGVDIVQTDAVYVGGILRQKEIASLAEQAGAKFAPHTWCSGPGLMANWTVMATSPAGAYVELPRVPNPMREGMLQEQFSLVNGMLRLPDTPGLGVKLSEEMSRWSYDPAATPTIANAKKFA